LTLVSLFVFGVVNSENTLPFVLNFTTLPHLNLRLSQS
jgi:hypothetical protein